MHVNELSLLNICDSGYVTTSNSGYPPHATGKNIDQRLVYGPEFSIISRNLRNQLAGSPLDLLEKAT